jgi:hypothetical protein
MTRTRGHRTDLRVTLTLAGLFAAVACVSCSPSGAGSISVPGGKDKLKVASKAGAFKPGAGPTRPSQAASPKP